MLLLEDGAAVTVKLDNETLLLGMGSSSSYRRMVDVARRLSSATPTKDGKEIASHAKTFHDDVEPEYRGVKYLRVDAWTRQANSDFFL
jgi:hypothetical protein